MGNVTICQCDVLIVGGGLGGLAVAAGLRRIEGLNWLLAEAADELRTATGTLIGIGDNGMTALEGLDPRIPEKLKEVAQPSKRSHSEERPLDPAVPPSTTDTPLQSTLYTVRWAAMQQVLAQLVDPSRVMCGHRCTGYSEGPQGFITVHFKDKPDIRAAVVVGADGVRSVIRGSMCPQDPGPRYLGFMNWNAVRHVPGSSCQPASDAVNVIYDKRGAFTTMVYLINAGCDYQFWQVRITSDEPVFTNGGFGGGGVPGSKARVMDRLQQLGWQDVLKEVAATDEALIYERAMWDRLPLASWSSSGGRVVLLGDAAHGMYTGPGQGARSAFEDAHQLVEALKQHWPNAAAVSQQYEAARVLRATIIQHHAAAMSNIEGFAQDLNAFWTRLHPEDDDRASRMGRFREFSLWLNSYPHHVHGLPGSKYTSPEHLQAWLEHCAQATDKHMDKFTYMEQVTGSFV